MTNKEKAEKKVQIAIDKLVDLLSIVPYELTFEINHILDKLRSLESDIIRNEKKFNS